MNADRPNLKKIELIMEIVKVNMKFWKIKIARMIFI